MKNPNVQRLWLLPLAIVILVSCQKEVSTNEDVQPHTNYASLQTTGSIADDPARIAKVPVMVSSEFYYSQAGAANKGPVPKKDTDNDGIPDFKDACPTQAETVNGYQDTDGCPDTAPPTSTPDSDGDGLADNVDACPTQAENFNGYQDTDGCPDTIPDSDGDGIPDNQDGCPTQAETVNGFQDEDGCPDTTPEVIPPTTLPTSYFMQTPVPGNQGYEGSCVPFAIAYGARSIEYFYQSGSSGYSNDINVFSPEYAYNLTKFGECGSGTSIQTVLDLLVSQGVCTFQAMPYSDDNGCSLMPNSLQNSNAANYKINSYAMIPNSDQAAIKTMLSQNNPVITTIIADNSFMNAGPGFIWQSYSGSGALPHTIVIVGYDDTKNAYKIMNSFGTSWGDGGFSWIDYNFFVTKSSYYTYVIQ